MDGGSNQWMARRACDIIAAVQPNVMVIQWSYTHRSEQCNDALVLDQRWQEFYRTIRDPGWPQCDHFQQFESLPVNIQQEIQSDPFWPEFLVISDEERRKFRTLIHHGYQDALRLKHPDAVLYSWWDYRAGRYDRNEGVRIDYLLTSSQATDRLMDAGIDRTPRGLEKPSDHTPVWIRLGAV
jgi:hypothetical protein